MDTITISPDRIDRMDSATRAVLALITTGISGGALRETDREPLDVHAALHAVDALAAAGVPPIAVDDDGVPLCLRGSRAHATFE
ncbi:hypothetical protein FA014_01840 [Cellulomonas hominis]|uniref:Uncharacterized protein n=1 Tax=Cellulomonas hominis TaxID=156981 RepID=A0A7Z8K1P9_9CELL|nr:hypothetical protein [Cellulomonas hominis]TKR27123.1 hypothetical protein FA014_01840 [Cellulomonas hominis]